MTDNLMPLLLLAAYSSSTMCPHVLLDCLSSPPEERQDPFPVALE
ncbi:hypothetical protein ACGFIV_00010 [Sphaerisporangium sp. NPDC049003]